MLRFWQNPEFVRHFRAELRPVRAATAAALVLVIAGLVGLSCWSTTPNNPQRFLYLFHCWLLGLQFAVLALGCVSVTGRAVAGERQLKTYDFLRTTRLTAREIMVGKILGAPVMIYFVIACSLPISMVAGLLAGVAVDVLLWDLLLMAALGIFASLVGLWGSMLAEGTGFGSRSIPLVLIYFFFQGVAGSSQTAFPGFAALGFFPSALSLYGVSTPFLKEDPTLLGLKVSFPLLTVLLYVLLGAWFALMLVRNLKKEREQIRLLSRWQAVGLAAFLNALFYALLDPGRLTSFKFAGSMATQRYGLRPQDVSVMMVTLNGFILFLVGLASLTPREKLKIWWRRHAAKEEGYFSESGLPWPWLPPAAAIAYGLLIAEAAGLRGRIALQEWQLGVSAVRLFVVLVFTTRDILFLQWCALTRMKRPWLKGFLYLCLYYTAVGVVALVVSVADKSALAYVTALTPFYALTGNWTADGFGFDSTNKVAISIGLALQIPLILVLLGAISNRLRRPAISPATASTA